MYSAKRLLALTVLLLLAAMVAWRLQNAPDPADHAVTSLLEPPPAAISDLAERLLACGAVQGTVERPGWFAADLDGAFLKLFEERTQLGDTATPEASLQDSLLGCGEEGGEGERCYPTEKYVFFSLAIDSFRTKEEALIIEHDPQRFEAIPLPIEYLNGRCTDDGSGRALSYGGQTLHLWTVWHQGLVSLCDSGVLDEDEARLCSEGCEFSERSDVLLHISPRAEAITTWTLKQSYDRANQVDPIRECLGITGNGLLQE